MSRRARLGLVCAVCMLACGPASAPTPDQRGVAYQAGILAAQANCVAILSDKEVPRTPAVEEWCVFVLRGSEGCKTP